MYLNELQALAHEQSVNKGFWATYDVIPLHLSDKSKGLQEELRVAILSQKLALVSSESTEALEDLRAGKPYEGEDALHIAEDGKPEGFASELADIVIRVLDLRSEERRVGKECRSGMRGGRRETTTRWQ